MTFRVFKRVSGRKLPSISRSVNLNVFSTVAGDHSSACISLPLGKKSSLPTIDNPSGCNQALVVKYPTTGVCTSGSMCKEACRNESCFFSFCISPNLPILKKTVVSYTIVSFPFIAKSILNWPALKSDNIMVGYNLTCASLLERCSVL